VEKHIDQMASLPQTNRVYDHLGITSGRYLRMKDETPTANLFVPTAYLAGTKLDRFGDSTGVLALG